MVNHCGIYFPSWASPWVSNSGDMDLAKIDSDLPGIKYVYLAFATPDCSYKKGQFSWNGTGIQFSHDWSVVVGAISILKSKGIIVMLSVGGGAYWSGSKTFNAANCVWLMEDLGCDGIDIDWEGHAERDYELTGCIRNLKPLIGNGKISFAGFSTGAFGKDGDTFKGSAIDAMVKVGSSVDWINVMAYDAGESFDPLGAFAAYRIYFPGPMFLGLLPGRHGWGDAVTDRNDVRDAAEFVKNSENKDDGVFIWAFGKSGNPDYKEMVSICENIFKLPTIEEEYEEEVEEEEDIEVVDFTCPVCSTGYRRV